MIRFDTPRLEIRDAEPADFRALLSLYTHKEVMRYISDGRSDWTLEELQAKYARINNQAPDGAGLFAVRLKETGELAGEAGLFDTYATPGRLELGYILSRDLWQKGYGTELCSGLIRYAFGLPGIVNLRARMYAANEASWRLCETMNMLRIAGGNTPQGRAFYEYELKREE